MITKFLEIQQEPLQWCTQECCKVQTIIISASQFPLPASCHRTDSHQSWQTKKAMQHRFSTNILTSPTHIALDPEGFLPQDWWVSIHPPLLASIIPSLRHHCRTNSHLTSRSWCYAWSYHNSVDFLLPPLKPSYKLTQLILATNLASWPLTDEYCSCFRLHMIMGMAYTILQL